MCLKQAFISAEQYGFGLSGAQVEMSDAQTSSSWEKAGCLEVYLCWVGIRPLQSVRISLDQSSASFSSTSLSLFVSLLASKLFLFLIGGGWWSHSG